MGKNISQIVDRLKQRYGFKSDTEVSEAIGMTKTALYNHKARGTVPYEALFTFCEKRELSFNWLLTGKGYPDIKKKEWSVDEHPSEYNKVDDFVYVPQVTGKIAAGGGLIPDNTIEIKIAFRKDWLQRKGEPRNMSIIRVQGDSMEDTLLSGDIVLIDHSRNIIESWGGIYAIALDGDIMIKRLQVLYPSNNIRIISDNSKYQPLEVEPGSIDINGKVIWFGREIER